MNSNYIYTKRLMGIDVNVVFSMLITALLSAGLLGYTIIKTKEEVPCKTFDFRIFGEKYTGNKIYYSGQQLIFRVAANFDDKVVWDFGDNSPKVESPGTRHTFTYEKIFPVTVTINGKCDSTFKINIKQKESTVIDSVGNILDPIDGEAEAFVNEPVAFTTPIDATSYRWSIDRSGYPVKNSKDATFTFKTSGIYTVRLMVDDDRTRDYKFTITVKPIKKLVDDAADRPIEIPNIETKEAPPIAPPAQSNPPAPTKEPAAPVDDKVSTSDDNLKDYLQSYLCGKTTLQALEPYFCDLNNTSVTVTEEKKLTSSTLANLCVALKCRRDIEIVSISQVQHSGKCVTSFLIHIQKTKQKKACPDN